MLQPWSFLLFPALYFQVFALQFAPRSPLAELCRKALLPVIAYFCWKLTYNSFDPEITNFPWNIAFFGVVPCFGVSRAIYWASVDPQQMYTWRSDPDKEPKNGFLWTLEAMISMRGLDWAFGAKAVVPPPIARDTTTFALRSLRKAMVLHVGMIVSSGPPIHFVDYGARLDQLLLPVVGYQASPLTSRLAWTIQAMFFAITAICVLEQGYVLSSLVACLFKTVGHMLGICETFQPTRWPPLFRNIFHTQSVRDFWSYRWHGLFLSDFMFFGFIPGRKLGRALGLGRTASYILGIAATFFVSGLGHEIALYTASRSFGFDARLRTFSAFFLQTFGLVAEQAFERLAGRPVRGRLGRIWAFLFVAFTFSFMVEVWIKRGLVEGVPFYSRYQWQRYLMPMAPLLPKGFMTN